MRGAIALASAWLAIFLWQAHALTLSSFSFSGAAFLHGEVWRPLSAPLIHANLTHLFLNMAMLMLLAIFLPRGWFAILCCGALAGECALAVQDPFANGFGASAGIYALLGALVVHDKKRRWLFAVVLLAGLAWHVTAAAHFAGALVGFVLGRFWPPRWLSAVFATLSVVAFALAAHHLNAPDTVACGTKNNWPAAPRRNASGG